MIKCYFSPYILKLVLIFCLAHIEAAQSAKKFTRRQQRALPLIFPPTAPTRTQWIIGIGIPLEELLFEAMTTGYVFKAEYALPSTAEQLRTKSTLPITVRSMKTKFEQHLGNSTDQYKHTRLRKLLKNGNKVLSSYRWAVYKVLEGLGNKIGLPGRECMLKSVCEAAETSFHYKNGLFGDLIHILLTPSSSSDELTEPSDRDYFKAEALGHSCIGCNNIYKNCTKSLLDHFSSVNLLTKDLFKMFNRM